MITVIQLVSRASVTVEGITVGAIERGIVALIGIEKNDTDITASKLLERILNYRIFPDGDGKANLSLRTVQGGLLLVPQFTLVAETSKGTRPGFSLGMPPPQGKVLFESLVQNTKEIYSSHVAAGIFGANMQVTLCNEGPMTFIMKS